MKYLFSLLFFFTVAVPAMASHEDYYFLDSDKLDATCVGGDIFISSVGYDRTLSFVQVFTNDTSAHLKFSDGTILIDLEGQGQGSLDQHFLFPAGESLDCFKGNQANQVFVQAFLHDEVIVPDIDQRNYSIYLLLVLVIFSLLDFMRRFIK